MKEQLNSRSNPAARRRSRQGKKTPNIKHKISLLTFNFLASWNFKHIVNLNRIRLYNSINLKLGYRMIEIRTPREILEMPDYGE